MQFTPDQIVHLQTVSVMLAWLAFVIALDLIAAVVLAVKAKTFRVEKLPEFLGDYGPKIVGWLLVEALCFLPSEMLSLGGIGQLFGGVAYTAIMAGALASVMSHTQALLGAELFKSIGIPATLQK